MLIIPAIDIKNGKCVRLSQGQMDKETIYSDDPVEMAGKWVAAGARRLHLVDLDGAVKGANNSGVRAATTDKFSRVLAAGNYRGPLQIGVP